MPSKIVNHHEGLGRAGRKRRSHVSGTSTTPDSRNIGNRQGGPQKRFGVN